MTLKEELIAEVAETRERRERIRAACLKYVRRHVGALASEDPGASADLVQGLSELVMDGHK